MELRRYWQIILKRYRTLLLIVGVTFISVAFFSLLATPVYKFTSKIWIRNLDPKTGILTALPSDLPSLGIFSTDLVMQGQLEIIQNHFIIEDVIAKLKLKNEKGQLYAVQDILNRNSLLLAMQKKGVKVSIPSSTQLIEVAGYSDEPRQAVELANQVAEGFVGLYNQTIRNEGKKVLRFAETQIPKLNKELRSAEKALYQFRAANNSGDITYYREKLLSSLTTLEDSYYTTSRESIETEKKIKQILVKLKKIPELRQSTISYNENPQIDYLRKKIADLEGEIASKTQKVTPKYLEVRQTQASLKRYKGLIKKEIREIFSGRTMSRNAYRDSLLESLGNSEISLAVAQARRLVYGQQISDKQKEIGKLSLLEMEQAPLERRVTALNTALTTLLKNEQTAKLAAESSLSNALVIEKASLPSQTWQVKKYRWFPQRTLMVILAAVLGLLFGLTIIFFQEYLDNSVADPQEAESTFRVPVLANLPELPKIEPFNIAEVMKQESWQRGIWQLRAMLRSQKLFSGIITITSACAKEGKTIITASLGQVLSMDKCRVLLVDLNFVHPRLGDLWQLSSGPGISEVLEGKISVKEGLQAIGPGEFYILPNGRANGMPLGYWDPARLADILTPLKSDYDFILVDLPAVGEGEGALFTKLGDQTLLVLAANQTPKDRVSRALEQIDRGQGQVLGLVLNNFRPAPDKLMSLWAMVKQQRANWPVWQEKFRKRGGWLHRFVGDGS